MAHDFRARLPGNRAPNLTNGYHAEASFKTQLAEKRQCKLTYKPSLATHSSNVKIGTILNNYYRLSNLRGVTLERACQAIEQQLAQMVTRPTRGLRRSLFHTQCSSKGNVN